MISARIIADSKGPSGNRCTSWVLVFPRMVLAEFNTHRMLSKNSASSRAIPFKKMVKYCQDMPFVPIKFQKEHTGMQGYEYWEGNDHEIRKAAWLEACDIAIESALSINSLQVTKQLCNRILEPFLYHTVICTGTDFENFFALRANPEAEIHIADLADKMLIAYNESTPKELKAGEWHIPFGDLFDQARLEEMTKDDDSLGAIDDLKIKIATARCARVSYLNFEGKDDYEDDLRVFEKLSNSGHMSPFEHCAYANIIDSQIGNFRGFTQVRKWPGRFPQENRKDPRVIKK